MKYKVGQKVRVIPQRPNLDGSKYGQWFWVSGMDKYCGKILTVKECGVNTKDYCYVYENNYCYVYENNYGWDNEWLLPLSKFREGDTVKWMTGQIITLPAEWVFKDEELELVSRKCLI